MDLIIIGAGGHAKVVFDAVQKQGLYKVICFVDQTGQGKPIGGVPLFNEMPSKLEGCHVIVAIGDNLVRRREYERMLALGLAPATIIHPSAVLAYDVEIGKGTVVTAQTVINPGARVGVNCIINTLSAIEHDCIAADHAHLSAGVNLGGAALVGEGALLGVGVSTLPKISIGDWSVVGAGAVVIRDVEANATVVGVPAAPIGRKVRNNGY